MGQPLQSEQRHTMDALASQNRRQRNEHKHVGKEMRKQSDIGLTQNKQTKFVKSPPHSWRECHAKDSDSRKCDKRGYFAAVCRFKHPVHGVLREEDIEQDSLF